MTETGPNVLAPTALQTNGKKGFSLIARGAWLSLSARNPRQVALDERDIGTFDGHVGAGSHGATYVGWPQCGPSFTPSPGIAMV